MHPTINGVGTTPIINILAIPSRRIRIQNPSYYLSWECRRHVANFSRKGMLRRHKTCEKRPRHTQFIPITADKFKSAQTYEYPSYHRVFVFELKKQSRYWACRAPYPPKIGVEKWRETEYCAPTPNGEATYQSTIIAKPN